ncbi:phosphate transport system permease protein PstC [Clostridium magnum DSM 2767]|uniref:Phosphate transport system permease protein n=2 Tax=Clostridium magnum TaxID=33954 RepID=A0A161WYS8_9CLOT|nr:phosphate transport system permease protein PstC [Clostridium magnum DSM 2767]SHH16291.1 phosphate ABC transporter membrane protein 1, PhoT family [Clostridium magnum DSM 2767]
MRNNIEKIFSAFIKFFAFIAISLLILILIFILKESIGLFNKVSFWNFVFGNEWQPLAFNPQVSIKPIIIATLYVSIIGVMIAVPIGVGFSVFISILVPEKISKVLKAFMNMLAAIPSVVYGFIGLFIIVKFFEVHFSFSTGESVFGAGILLAIMILPYIVSICNDTVCKIFKIYKIHSQSLGVSKWYMMNNLILPACKESIIASTILATGRAMGETMAVMMVIGNCPIMPTIFGRGETIPSLIALEMGSARIGSLHYHALFASGFILMLLLLIINAVFYGINRKINI